MPQNSRNNEGPPPVMTWSKAGPVLALAVIFDALRFMFEMFWFFGPAIAGVICTVAVSSDNAIATSLGALGCSAGAVALGVIGVGVFETFGVIMAMATGLVGWLTIGLILLLHNRRILAENAIWFAGSLLVSEIPIVGAIPAITLVLWRMYSRQIKLERAAFAAYQAAHAASMLEERQRQEAALAQAQFAYMEQSAANDEVSAQEQAAIDEQSDEAAIPDKEDKAA